MKFHTFLGSAAAGLALVATGAASAQQGPPQASPKVRQACMADFQRLCPDVQPGHGAVGRCMREHRADISPDCRTALMAARERNQERRAAGQEGPQTAPPQPPSR
jgi:hypothetical protein